MRSKPSWTPRHEDEAVNDPVPAADRARAVAAAQGRQPFDLLLAGGTVVDVGCGELRAADVGIVGSLVASVHESGSRADAGVIFDCTSRWIAPGFMDLHVHFESSMLTPGSYAAAVCPRGTTTVFADPHELANVAGVEGVRYAVDASRHLPVRFLIQAPSCVPPQPGLERSGADLYGPDIATMLAWPEVAGLAEVMDMLGVLSSDERMVEVVSEGLASGKLVSGHAAGLSGPALQAYLAAGMASDHEIFTEPDCLEKLRAGMTVELRGAVDAILPAIVEQVERLPLFPTHLVAATDDLFALTLLTEGGIDHLLRRLVGYGMDPVQAIRCATYNAAYRLGRNDLGLVSAGRQADVVVLGDLAAIDVEEVFFAGRHVASGGRMLVDVVEAPSCPPLRTIRLEGVTPADMQLRLDRPDGTHRVRVVADPVMTRWAEVDVEVSDGLVSVPAGHIVQVVIHRYGRIPAEPRHALLSGWGDWCGAVATTVSHDTHNLVVFGRDPADMALAANQVIADGGGVAVVANGRVTASIGLPIAGILSPLPPEEVAELQRAVQEAAMEVGLFSPVLTQPLFQVMLSSLACLPGPHLTDLGIIDGTTGKLLDGMLVP
jgi:adenine deaminase